MVVEIHIVTPVDQQAMARLGVPPTEWDVMIADTDEFLGVIEWFDYGYMFTDSFGKQTEYLDGETLHEIFDDVVRLYNPEIVN